MGLGDWLEDAGDAIGDLGGAIAGKLEDIGNAGQDLLESLGDALGDVPLVGGAIDAFCEWFGGVYSGLFDFLAAVVNGAAAILGAILTLLGALVSWDLGELVDALEGLLAAIVGAVLLVLGKLVAFIQAIFLAEARKRKLTNEEICLLRRVFHRSLAILDIRIVRGRSGLFGRNDRPLTLGNTIYMKDTAAADWLAILVHESTHVWQYQHDGPRYVGDALIAQFTMGRDASGNQLAYVWQRELPKRWADFNAEAQGKTLEHVYRYGGLAGVTPQAEGQYFWAEATGGIGTFVMPAIPGYTAGDFTFVADDAVATLRAAVNHRPSVARLDGYRCPGPPVFPGLVVATLKSARSTEVREPA